ncbi:MAG: type IV pilus secretin PilQ [Methylococcaceae bacterium]|nr:type IV pilus secretin PilQ [Methylococcaceae bacterium]
MKISRNTFDQQSSARRGFWGTGLLFALFTVYASFANAAGSTLKSIEFASLPGDQLQFQLEFDGEPVEPKVFQTDNPARISMDFMGVSNGLKKKMIPVNEGVASGIHAVEASGRTRVVINLLDLVPYDTRIEGNSLFVTLSNEGRSVAAAPVKSPGKPAFASVAAKAAELPPQTIRNIDFRRGAGGEGRILISLNDPNTVVDMQEQGGKVVLRFINTGITGDLAKSLDVTDFATPIRRIDTRRDGSSTTMVVTPLTSDYDYSSYQTEGLLTVEFRPLTPAEKEIAKKKKFEFSGQRLSLNFQDIEVRSVLQILADFTNLNIVASDTVGGNITLRLNDVPWDQAMDIILKSKGLAKRQTGNVILVGPIPEINKLEKEELEAYAVKEKLEPLKTEIIQIKYAKAADIQKVLMGVQETEEAQPTQGTEEYIPPRSPNTLTFPETNLGASTVGDTNQGSILSERGTVNIDDRTNVLIVKDTPQNLEAVRTLVNQLDKAVQQVMIESRVVIANDNFSRELGVRLEAAGQNGDPNTGSGFQAGGVLGNVGENLITDLAVGAATGGLGVVLFKASEFLLRLELTAAQAENLLTIVSNPKLVTTDQNTASIEQGVEIPFQTQSSLGGTNTQFKKAVLKLEVTPHITPDDVILMDVLVQNDTAGTETPGGLAIDRRAIETSVQVESGETVVLGGVYIGETRNDVDSVPFFGELPGIGWLFRRTNVEDNKRELLIFITPRILKESIKAI